jgi:hypothetical protein
MCFRMRSARALLHTWDGSLPSFASDTFRGKALFYLKLAVFG